MLISNMDIGSEAYAEPAASAQAPIAELNEVSKSFGTVQAVSDMNLSIAQSPDEKTLEPKNEVFMHLDRLKIGQDEKAAHFLVGKVDFIYPSFPNKLPRTIFSANILCACF